MSIVTRYALLPQRRTKIVATLGPASQQSGRIRELILAGVNVFRVNMSHGSHADHATAIANIREQAAALGTFTGILVDLCGPKIRMGRFAESPLNLTEGALVTVTTREVTGDAALIPSQYAGLAADVVPGDRILLNDGAAELSVLEVAGTEVHCRVVEGGPIGDRKGINLPGVKVSAPSLTDKDREDARFALAQQADFIALSFVRTAEDVRSLLELIDANPWRPSVIAKIEKPEALENLEEILEAADGIMVARGDLGVELPPEQVPIAQSQLVRAARLHDKPVIVATQMLESMITAARPTRAEVSDVSGAVGSGADAVMLSAETAIGEHAVEAVETMHRIARQTESYQFHARSPGIRLPLEATHGHASHGNAVASATALLVAQTQARAVVVFTRFGVTAAALCAARPPAPVIVVSDSATVCRRMSLLWGALPVLDAGISGEEAHQTARRIAREAGLAEAGQVILLVQGFNKDPQLEAPSITLLRV